MAMSQSLKGNEEKFVMDLYCLHNLEGRGFIFKEFVGGKYQNRNFECIGITILIR